MNEEQEKVWGILESPKSWIAIILEDPNDPNECILQFPEGLLERVGWKEGDTLSWEATINGVIIVRKV